MTRDFRVSSATMRMRRVSMGRQGMPMLPQDAIAAVTHDDPYAYYADLVAHWPLHRDDARGLWVAAGAGAVAAVLANPLCRVRPPAEPVPAALVGTPAGDIFGRLVRMNDGESHCPFKQAVSASLMSIDDASVAATAADWARRLAGSHDVNAFAFALSGHVLGSLLGVPADALPALAASTGDFVRCIAPAPAADQLARGQTAAAQLLDLFQSLLADTGNDGLLRRLAREADAIGRPASDVIVANGIGFLSQAYEATAGLVGNTLVALARHRDVATRAMRDAAIMERVVSEVVRWDPPVQNTRRFVVTDGVVAGQAMAAGDAILVVLAAANRDPAANPQPERFDIARRDRRSFTFGGGVHACPGERVATRIAQAGVTQLLAAGLAPASLLSGLTYRPSANTRIPVFA